MEERAGVERERKGQPPLESRGRAGLGESGLGFPPWDDAFYTHTAEIPKIPLAGWRSCPTLMHTDRDPSRSH
jgi:hypothetical protein